MQTRESPTFGELLRHHRDGCGLTQAELAERAGLSTRAVSDLERGAKRRPHRDTVRLLAEALGLAGPARAAFEAARGRSTAIARIGNGPDGGSSLPGWQGEVLPPLVGRAHELALLGRHLAREGPPVLLLAGEPGIGKSRLLREVAGRALGQGWRVMEGGCQRHGGHAPYAPLLAAVQGHIRARPLVQLRADLQGCAWLVRLLPELAEGPIEPLPAWTLTPEQERRLMVTAVVRFLRNVAGPLGTLLVLDDLQWAGPDALDLLTALARSTPALPLRIVGAYRDTEVQPRDSLGVLLADLAHARLAAQRHLGPLSKEEAGQLLATLLPEEVEGVTLLRERVARRTGGVPFYLVSCAQAARLGELNGGSPAVPWDVAQGIRQRVATVPQAAQEVLGAAAVAVGRIAHPALLSAVVDYPEREVLAALEAAWRARLLDEADGAYRFAHDLVREAVEADLSAARRRMLHRRMAEALEQQSGEPPVEALAYHWARSSEQEKAVIYLEQAGDRAQAQGAQVAAEGYYRDLVDALDGLARDRDACRAREKLGTTLSTLARYAEALVVLEWAAARYRTLGDLEGEGRVAAQIGQLHVEMGTPEQGLGRVQPLVGLLAARGPSPALAALQMALAALFGHCGRYSEQLAAAEQATSVARMLGDTRLLAAAHGSQGTALKTMGRFAEGVRALQEALRLAESGGELGNPSAIEMLYHAAVASAYGGQSGDAARYTDRALRAAERLGDPGYIAWILNLRGTKRRDAGDWEAARTDLEQAVAMYRALDLSSRAAWALSGLGRLHREEGAWEAATSEVEEARSIAERGGDRMLLLCTNGVLAEIEICQGQPAAARARLLPLLAHQGMRRQLLHFVLPRLAWAYLEMGETSEAAALLQQIVGYVREAGEVFLLAEVAWLVALVAGRQGRWDEAAEAVEEGLVLARSMPYPYAEARTLQADGLLCHQKGEPEPARERLEAALALFRRLGARKDIEQTEQLLGSLG